jgi:DNA-binding response OmpR family regulator
MKKRVLIIDNDPVFLEQRQDFLEGDDPDFEITTANTLEMGRRLMREEYFHVVTIDVGMSDAESDRDTTGLQLVHDPEFAHIVKIVITGPHNDVTLSSNAMRRPENGAALPPAVDFLLKMQGPEAMRDTINTAIRRDGKINAVLPDPWPSRGSAGDLVGMLEPDAPGDQLFRRGEELTDVLRKAFVDYDRVRIVGRLWHHGPRAALAVTAWRGGANHERLIIVGQHEHIRALYEAYRRHMPERAPRGHAQLIHSICAPRTLRYAGAVFELPGAQLTQVRSLRHFYADSNPNEVRECIRSLVTDGLKPWSQHPKVLGAADHADNHLRQQAGLSEDSPQRLRERIQYVGQMAERKKEASLWLTDGQLTIRPFRGEEHHAADPAEWLAQPGPAAFSRLLSAGESCDAPPADTILVADSRRAWLTDYGQIGHGLLLSSVAALEASVLFDLHAFPDLVLFADAFSELLRCTDLAQAIGAPLAALRKPFLAIQQLRQQAAKADYGGDMEAYHRALFYHAAQRLLSMPDEELHDDPLRGLCLCLGLGLLAGHLTAPAATTVARGGLIVDEDSGQMWLEGHLITPTPRAREFLRYLWGKRGKFCTNADIVKACRDDSYSASYVHTLAKEAREALGPLHERYLFTGNSGYTLFPDGRPEAPPNTL